MASYAAAAPPYASSSPYYGGGPYGGGGPLNGGAPPSASASTNGRLSSPPGAANPWLRKRDAAALLTCLLLLRLAFAPPGSGAGGIAGGSAGGSASASVELAFYAPFKGRAPRSKNGSEDGGRDGRERTTARPVPLDLDGDGGSEALVVPVFLTRDEVREEKKADRSLEAEKRKRPFAKRPSSSADADVAADEGASEGWDEGGSWGLRVLNLKPLRRDDNAAGGEEGGAVRGPFAPRSMFLAPLLPYASNKPSDGEDGAAAATTAEPRRRDVPPGTYPLKILTVQIPIRRTRLGEEEKSRQRHKSSSGGTAGSYGKNSDIPPKDDPKYADYDRKRHYFCGTDWHHAANSCHKHCPGGVSSECGDGETCYADTPVSIFEIVRARSFFLRRSGGSGK